MQYGNKHGYTQIFLHFPSFIDGLVAIKLKYLDPRSVLINNDSLIINFKSL